MTKIVSWNVNSIRARLALVLEWVTTVKPDIILLQELKCVDEAFPRTEFEDLGYNIAVSGQKSYNGVAILSKTPMEDVLTQLPGDEEDTQARYIEAVIGDIRVASIYVPNGQEVGSDKFHYKLKFLNRLYEHAHNLLKYEEKAVLSGDYNIAPEVADVYDPELIEKNRILCSLEERSAFRKFTHLGYVDALRQLFPSHETKGERLYTWWDYRAGSWQNDQGMRIDHFLISPQASKTLEAGAVEKAARGLKQPSDHAPVWIELS